MPHFPRLLAPALFGVLLVLAPPTWADEPKKTPRPKQAIERGLAFLRKDAKEWRETRQCATCHHGTMTVWAFSEARSRGYAIDKEVFADTVKWTKERLANIDKPRDTRPGWSMVSTPALFLATMALAVPDQEALSAEELKKIAGHLVRHQEKNGAWEWSSAPAQNRPPPVFESDEVATLLAVTALNPHVPRDGGEKSDVRDAREKAAAWLAKNMPSETTQGKTLRLFHAVQEGKPAKDLQPQLDEILALQNKDGGWGQDKDSPSDAYATGQALYFLSIAGVKPERKEIQRAVAFLLATQKPDGSWPMKPRAHPGAKPANNTVPIAYFGSAWATMGLLRTTPK
jgi:hypothetical protein